VKTSLARASWSYGWPELWLLRYQRQTQLRMRFKESDREALDCIDYMMSIVAATGKVYGTLTWCMKQVRSFVEASVATIYVDDVAASLRKFTTGMLGRLCPRANILTDSRQLEYF
jgi:isocitrate lyase